jgi:hypothetical protein
LEWNDVEKLEGNNTNGNTYYVGVNIPDPTTYTVTPAVNSFTQSIAEYTYNGISVLTLSNFTITATLTGQPQLDKAVGYTYYLLINNTIKSSIILNSSVSPQTGNDITSFTISPGDKVVIRAVLNPGAFNPNNPDDITFKWVVNIA